MKLVHIDSSILGSNSVSRDLSAQIVAQLKAENPALEITYYDLAQDPVSHLSGSLYAAQAAKPEDRTPEQQRDVEYSAKIMEDFLSADVLVIGAPMYNFGISTQLKSWIDRIAVAGKTFKYTATGAVGLAGGKRVIIASSRGGFYGKDTPQFAADHQESYLATVFGFIGIPNIEFIRAEGVATGPENKAKAIEAAVAQIKTVASVEAAA